MKLCPRAALVLTAALMGCVDLSRPPLRDPVVVDARVEVADGLTQTDAAIPEPGPAPIPEPADVDGGVSDGGAGDLAIDILDASAVDMPPVDTTAPMDSEAAPDMAPPPADTVPPVDAPAAGLLLYWTFDDVAGTAAADASGRGLHGTYLATPAGAPIRSTDAAPVPFSNPASRLFDGARRQAVLLDPMPPALNPTAELTLAAWYRATSLDPVSGAAEILTLGNNQLLRLRAADIEVSKRVLTSEGWQAHVRCFAPVSGHLDGGWHHVATVIDAAAVRVYFDGVQRCLLADDDPMTYDLGNELWVGRHISSESYDFNGQLDDVRIYGRALSATEVSTLATRRP